jgi:acylphosphatase
VTGDRLSKASAKISVSGIVQGVGYRSFALHHGRALGLDGFVRNSLNGTVELEVEGERGGIEALVTLLKEGPRAARVSDVDVQWTEFSGQFDGFEVRF